MVSRLRTAARSRRTVAGILGVAALAGTLLVTAAGTTHAQTLPQLSINSITVQEGSTTDPDTATDKVVEFVFGLSPTINEDVEVGFNFTGPYDTSQPAATEGDDFTSPGSAVTIPANSSSVSLLVTIEDDFLNEATEHFRLIPSVSSNAELSESLARYVNDDPQDYLLGHWATGTITDNDPLPQLMLVPEQDVSTENGRVLRYQLTLSEESGRRVTVKYEVLPGLKRVDSSNNVTDLPDNPCSSFTDNEDACEPATPVEDYGPSGGQTWSDNGTPGDTTDDVLKGEFTFEPGETGEPDSPFDHPEINISLVQEGDGDPNVDERDETVTLRILPTAGFAFATDGDRFAHGLILDDDLPRVSLNQWGTGPEIAGPGSIGVGISPVVPTGGDPVEVKYKFVSGVSVEPVNPDLGPEEGGPETVQCTAVEGRDYEKGYTGDFGTITFGPGDSQKRIPFTKIDDTVDEPDERVCVQLFEVSDHALLELHPYLYDTLTDNDDPPNFEILNAPEAAEDDPTNTNGGRLTFQVRLNTPSDTDPTTVAYETADGTARAGVDYVADSGTLTFQAGTEPETLEVTVRLLPDDVHESNETLKLVLKTEDVVRDEGTGTILDNDGAPRLSVAPVTVDEDDGTLDFSVRLSGRSSHVVTVNYDTGITGDTATEGASCSTGVDYIGTTGSLEFPAEQASSQPVSVPICDDAVWEGDEAFTLTLSSPSNARFAGQATSITTTGTIDDDEQRPSLSIDNATVNEIDGTARLTVTLDPIHSQQVTVNYATADGTGSSGATGGADCATDGVDFVAIATTELVFAPSETTKTIDVEICNDDVDEDLVETFTVRLSGQQNAGMTDSTGEVQITDDEDPPTLSFQDDDVTVDEADGSIAFVVELTGTSDKTVTVKYATADDSATSPADFTAPPSNARLSFAPGVATQTITLAVRDDSLDEADEETFTLTLSEPSNASLADADATGRITDDDDPPALSVTGGTVPEDITERNANNGLVFTVRLKDSQGNSTASGRDVSVYYTTVSGTGATGATEGEDFTATFGTMVIRAGQRSGTVTVPILDDALDENAETFTLQLSSEQNATLDTAAGDDTATGTITDNDADAELSVENARATEGGAVTFTVTLDPVKDADVDVSYSTSNGTATGGADCTGGADYVQTSGTETITAQGNTLTITVDTCPDSIDEPDEETFKLRLTSSDAVAPSDSATGIILDAQALPQLSVNDPAAVVEGNPGTNVPGGSKVVFEVTLSPASGRTVTVDYASMGGTATQGVDYTAESGTLTFAAGDTTKTVEVTFIKDLTDEDDENFTLELSNPEFAQVSDGSGEATITDDDGEPGLSVNDPTARENAGIVTFTVTLSPASSKTVTISYFTSGDTAETNVDYIGVSVGRFEFAPGEVEKTIDIVLINDTIDEDDERFTLEINQSLGNDLNATILDGTGEATILDDDTTTAHSTGGGGGTGGGSGGGGGGGGSGSGGGSGGGTPIVSTNPAAAPRIGVFLQDVVLIIDEPPLQIDLVASIVGAIDSYRALAANPGIVSAVVSGSQLTLAPEALGTTTVSVTAGNSRGSVFQSFRVTVIERGAPKLASLLPNRVLYVGDPPVGFDVSPAFTGTVASYGGSAGDPNLVGLSMTGSRVSLTGLAPGVTTVTVHATNANGVALQSFMVTVLSRQAPGADPPGPVQEIPTH